MKSIHQKLEEIAKNHLEIPSLHKSQQHDRYNFSIQQIEKALKYAYLMGERYGYKHGFSDARQTCDCPLDYVFPITAISPLVIDKPKTVV